MDTRERLRDRRRIHQKALKDEMDRLTKAAIEIGVKRIVLFGSAVKGHTGLTSDLDFLVVWDTQLDYLDGYYIPTRYPNGLPDSIPARVYTRPVAKEVLYLADQVLNTVKSKLAAK